MRGSLKVRATNGEIDALFNEFDADGGGTIDLTELKPALRALRDAAADAEAERASASVRGADMRKLAEETLAAAAAMNAIEEQERQLTELGSWQGAPLAVRLGVMMARRGKRAEEMAGKWPGALQQGSGSDKQMFANKKAFRTGMADVAVDGSPPTPAEVDAWFDSLVREEREAGGAGAGAGSEKGEPPTVEMVKVLTRAREQAAQAQQEQHAKARHMRELKKAARAEQATIRHRVAEQERQRADAETEAQRARAEEAAAEEAVTAARAEARRRSIAKKAEEKADFEARIAAKRSSQGSGDAAPWRLSK